MKHKCAFCREEVELPAEDTPAACPRCEAIVLFTHNPAFWFVEIAVGRREKTGLIIEKADNGFVFTWWDREKKLTTAQVAKILRITKERASALAPHIPGAFRAAPSRKRYRRGRWLIPMGKLEEYMARNRSSRR